MLSMTALHGQKTLLRKNIDNFTKKELAAYEQAWKLLKQRSERDKYDTAGYMWQAWIHNKKSIQVPGKGEAYPGPCEHATTLFLPWHRAQLHYFEKLLQSTDPEGKLGIRTDEVTIPYWNFLREPTGRSFPKGFERKGSPLYHANRTSGSRSPTFSKDFVATMVYYYPWLDFGGAPADETGFGFFELIVHNYMHNFVGGDMADQTLAALDPLFFSYHAYIDLLFERWIQENGSQNITSGEYYLRGTQPQSIPKPPGFVPPTMGSVAEVMGRSKDFFDLKKLGVQYEIKQADRLPARDEIDQSIATYSNTRWRSTPHGVNSDSFFRRFIGFNYPLISNKRFLALDEIIDISGFNANNLVEKAQVDLITQEGFEGKNYQVDVYLFPASYQGKFSITNSDDQNRYLIGSHTVWGKGAHHTIPASTRLTVPLNSILIGREDETKWIIRVVTGVNANQARATLKTTLK